MEVFSMKWLRDESGQVLVLTLFSMGILLGCLGLAIDVGVLFHARRNMQAVADAAAMAGATEMYYNGANNVDAKAKAAAKGMGVDAAAAGNTVNVAVSPTLTGGVACPSCVEVRVATPNPTIFIATMSQWFFKSSNFSSVNVGAMAVAGAPGASQNCMYVMDPTAPSSLWIHGAGEINAPGCGVYVNSNDPGALCVTGSAGKSDVAVIAVNGGQASKGGCGGDPGDFPVNTNSGVQSLPGTLANLPSDPTTNCPGGSVTNVATLSGTVSGPGYGVYRCYANPAGCTTTTKKGVTTTTCTPVTLSSASLGPGIYVFETGVKITGATTIGANSANGGATVVISKGDYDSGTATTFYDYAPTSGTYNGVAIYQPASNSNQLLLQFGSGSSIFDGAVVAPSAAVDLHDQGGAVNATDLIVGQAYINGKVNLTNYSAYNPITTPFKHITLVE